MTRSFKGELCRGRIFSEKIILLERKRYHPKKHTSITLDPISPAVPAFGDRCTCIPSSHGTSSYGLQPCRLFHSTPTQQFFVPDHVYRIAQSILETYQTGLCGTRYRLRTSVDSSIGLCMYFIHTRTLPQRRSYFRAG